IREHSLGFFRKHPKKILAVIGVVIVVVVIALLRGSGDQQTTHVVERNTVVQQVIVSGRVQAVDDVNLAFETSGRVTRIPFSAGDKVVRGQILAQLDASTALAELASAQANLEIQRALVQGTNESIAGAETNVINAEIALQNT